MKSKLKLGDSNSGNRRLSAGGDSFVPEVIVHPGRQKFRAKRSLSVTQASVKGEQSGEFAGLWNMTNAKMLSVGL
jgi:hypothetical protein